MSRVWLLLFGLSILSPGFIPESAGMAGVPDQKILLVYSGNALGELKPCGCAREADQGGIERRMSYIKKVRSRPVNTIFVDTGDNFKEPTRQGRLKAEYFLQALEKMDYDAVGVGEHDLVYGNEIFTDHGENIPWLSGNLEFGELKFSTIQWKRFKDGANAAILAVVDPALYYGVEHSGGKVTDPANEVRQRIRELKNQGPPDLIVLMTHMTREKALGFLEVEGVDVVVNGHIRDENELIDMEPVRKNGKIFVQAGPLGQKMGELEITFSAEGNKSFAQRMVRLDEKFPLAPEMKQLYDEYNSKVEELFFQALASKRNKDGKKTFATDKTCKTCHADIHKKWLKSRHAHAYNTLRKINKAFDPECLVCHVTGFNTEGGFISEIDTPELENVQCEVCHGPAVEHTRSPQAGFGNDARQACTQCHVKNHSPAFNYDTYWPKIRH